MIAQDVEAPLDPPDEFHYLELPPLRLLARTGDPEPVPATAEVPPAPEVRARMSALVMATSALALTPDVDRAGR